MNLNATLLGESIAFIVFVWFTMKYVWPPLNGAIEERQNKIADGLAASERAEKDLELAQEKATEQLKEAKAQAAEIIEQAKKRATQIVDEETQKRVHQRIQEERASLAPHPWAILLHVQALVMNKALLSNIDLEALAMLVGAHGGGTVLVQEALLVLLSNS